MCSLFLLGFSFLFVSITMLGAERSFSFVFTYNSRSAFAADVHFPVNAHQHADEWQREWKWKYEKLWAKVKVKGAESEKSERGRNGQLQWVFPPFPVFNASSYAWLTDWRKEWMIEGSSLPTECQPVAIKTRENELKLHMIMCNCFSFSTQHPCSPMASTK